MAAKKLIRCAPTVHRPGAWERIHETYRAHMPDTEPVYLAVTSDITAGYYGWVWLDDYPDVESAAQALAQGYVSLEEIESVASDCHVVDVEGTRVCCPKGWRPVGLSRGIGAHGPTIDFDSALVPE